MSSWIGILCLLLFHFPRCLESEFDSFIFPVALDSTPYMRGDEQMVMQKGS